SLDRPGKCHPEARTSCAQFGARWACPPRHKSCDRNRLCGQIGHRPMAHTGPTLATPRPGDPLGVLPTRWLRAGLLTNYAGLGVSLLLPNNSETAFFARFCATGV